MQFGAPQELPLTRFFVNTGDPIESENLMEFRLLYEGELLPSSNTKRRAKEKHSIRRVFHPQLKRLWQVKPNLRSWAERAFSRYMGTLPSNQLKPTTEEERVEIGIKAIGKQWACAGFEWVPLVIPEHTLQCSLDILLLRPEEDRLIFEQGDIDGQVKTLFDALKIPRESGEAGNSMPEADECPFFCLLQDDRLISEVRVTADQLLMLPQQREVRANECFVVIHVKLNHKDARTFDNYFG